ncbi:MAG TPA: hypothetical protein VFL41_11745 [Gaiellaceae bacterium]|nr:hypothetical protein [Gaiellaceae bacterium]HET8652655.1 hypothetical protein [Gaiellaceae bacterium]
MNLLRIVRRVVLLGVAAAIVLFAGATTGLAGDNPEKCFVGGKAVCIDIDDTDDVSPSTGAVSHYMRNVVKIRNNTGSALTNLKITLTLTDRFDNADPPTTKPSTADYVEKDANGNPVSTAACSESATASNVLTCTAPNLGAAGTATDTVTLQPLVFRTSNSAGVLATTMKVDVAAKEGGREQPSPKDPTNEQFSWSEETLLEGDPNAQRSWVFPGASVTLTTTKVGQYSTFPINVPTTFGTSLVAKLEESKASEGTFCPTCFGEQLTTVATGIFDATNIVEIQTVVPLTDVPNGVTEKNLTVLHKLDGGGTESITAKCSGEIDSGTPPMSELSCRRVVISQKLGTLTVEAFSKFGNGQWGFF